MMAALGPEREEAVRNGSERFRCKQLSVWGLQEFTLFVQDTSIWWASHTPVFIDLRMPGDITRILRRTATEADEALAATRDERLALRVRQSKGSRVRASTLFRFAGRRSGLSATRQPAYGPQQPEGLHFSA